MKCWIRGFAAIAIGLNIIHVHGMDSDIELKNAYALLKQTFPYSSHEEKLAILQVLADKDVPGKYNLDKITKIVTTYSGQPWGVELDVEKTILFLLLIEYLFNIKYGKSINISLAETADIIEKAKSFDGTCCNSKPLNFKATELLMRKAGVLKEISYPELFEKRWANLAELEAELIRVGLVDEYISLLKQSLKQKKSLIDVKKFSLPEGAVI